MSNHVPAPATLERLQRWFASCANGDWEHRYGISIKTLDNPGWVVSIDMQATSLEARQFEEQQDKRSNEDWYRCRLEGTTFRGYGGQHNLNEILDVFLNWAEPLE
jgi:hypothetical protein